MMRRKVAANFARVPGAWSKAWIKAWEDSFAASAVAREDWWPPRRWRANWQDSITGCCVTGWSMRNGDCGTTNRSTKQVSDACSASWPPNTVSSSSRNHRWRGSHRSSRPNACPANLKNCPTQELPRALEPRSALAGSWAELLSQIAGTLRFGAAPL